MADDLGDSPLSTLFGPSYVNKPLLDQASARITGALSQAREQRATAREQFGNTTQEMVRALDETTNQLRSAHESQWNLPLMAFGAGMLRAKPGVAGNFLTELGQGLDSTIPVIQQQRMKDQDFWKQIAELQQTRGVAASLPSKVDLAQSEKEISELERNRSTLEAAGIRGIPAGDRIAQQQERLTQQMQQKRQELLAKLQNDARNDAKEMTKNFEGVQPEDMDALIQTILHDRIQKFNAQPGQDMKLEPPQIDQATAERATKVRSGLQKKGLDEYRAKRRAEITKQADAAIRMQYPAFSSLDPDQQEALRQEHINRLIEEGNKGVEKGSEPYMEPTVFSPQEWAGINAAKAQHERMVRIGEPTKEEIEANHLPSSAAATTANRYKNLPYGERTKRLAADDLEAKKEMDPIKKLAADLPSRIQGADEAMHAYDATSRKGLLLGSSPAAGSDEAQLVDKFVASLAFSSVPQGQGSISDAERAIIAKSNPTRAMERGAFQTLVDVYKENARRANDELAFFQNWQDTFKTTHGAREAWNEYVNSPAGMILRQKKDGAGLEINPRRITWREYFDRRNKGEPVERAPVERYVTDPKTGRLVKATD
jgi:hypothetical protein